MSATETSSNERPGQIRPGSGQGRGRRLHAAVLSIGLVAGFSAPVASAQTPSGCAALVDSNLPAYLEGWSGRAPLNAAAGLQSVELASLPVGVAKDAQLLPTEEIAFPVSPTKPGGPTSFGGVFSLQIAAGGDYRVSLGSGAWIEVTKGGARVESRSHAEGPACSSLRKTVVFSLQPGTYILELSAAGQSKFPIMVTQVH